MASMMSKRQQARNEKALQDLVNDVPGNNTCADCYARNPAWASWSLGVFLCMRCAAIHRKLGTHISKVKSLSMDGWANEQVDNMKTIGNAASNKKYNPENKRPPVPIDADEADSAMERFIRSKYVQRSAALAGGGAGNGNGRSTRRGAESDDDTPPPPPPKTGGFFKKKQSSTFPLFRSKKSSHPVEAPQDPRELRNKPSKVFGASVHNDNGDDTARKLTQLRDMGFTDEKRNTMVLKGVNGNLEKTIETLVRLGEGGGGGGGGGGAFIPARESSLQTSNALPTPRSLSPAPNTPTTAGLSRTSASTANSPSISNNPWDISPAPPQSSQSTGTMPNTNPFYSTNPFGPPSQQGDFGLNQSMQNLSLAPAQPQQLFPHHTGGLPAPQPVQQSIYQQSMTPPLPQAHNLAAFAPNGSQVYQQHSAQHPQQQPQQSYNPFMQSPAQQQQNLSLNTIGVQNQGGPANNPFLRSPTRVVSPTLGQIPEQSQQNFYGTPTSAVGNNPFFATNQPAQQPQQYPAAQPFDQSVFQPPQQQQQPYQQMQQYQIPQAYDQSIFQSQPQQDMFSQSQPQPVYQAPRDKASIMALYNIPSMAPSPLQAQTQAPPNSLNSQAAAMQQQSKPAAPPQQSVAHAGNKNPFLNGGASPPAAYASSSPSVPFGSARSRESVTLGMQMDWNNGRHSPDAFASLSARGN